ncbi:hypothetical protein OSTOST_17438, partial [Ostertagia ostertagi]
MKMLFVLAMLSFLLVNVGSQGTGTSTRFNSSSIPCDTDEGMRHVFVHFFRKAGKYRRWDVRLARYARMALYIPSTKKLGCYQAQELEDHIDNLRNHGKECIRLYDNSSPTSPRYV